VRELEISVVDGDQVEEENWLELHPQWTIKTAIGCSFELAEETIGLIEYTNGVYEVGIGEPLRPYIKIYGGYKRPEAYAAFWTTVQVRAMIGEPTDFPGDDSDKPNAPYAE
jgi:hypothetical protein